MKPTIDEYLYSLDELLDDVEVNGRIGERLACTVFCIGKQYNWDVEMGYDEDGYLMTNIYR